jgi:hypothetical protein
MEVELSRVARPIIYLVIVGLIFTLFGFRVAHPKSGLRSAAGEANTALVAYKHSDTFQVGDKVVIRLDEKSKSPAIGIVRTIEKEDFVVQTGDLILTVPNEKVSGKLLGVFPFIGSIFTIIGL